jgi:hypothetical protein
MVLVYPEPSLLERKMQLPAEVLECTRGEARLEAFGGENAQISEKKRPSKRLF